MALNIPLQPSFLYKGSWTAENDSILAATLIRLKKETMWTLDEFPIYFLLTARKEIKAKTGVDFNEAEMKSRVGFLKERYQTFKKVTADDEAHWELPFKFVDASDEVWTRIMKKLPLAGAYYYHDEPIFNEIATLFGMDDVKVETSNQVIVISDTTEKLSFEEDDEEVNSPIFAPETKARRKLFVDHDGISDRLSSSGRMPPPTKKMGHRLPDGNPPWGSPLGSSVASSSPAERFRGSPM